MTLEQQLKKVYGSKRWDKKFHGIIYTFDLDKTYLATEFETIKGLIKIPFEDAKDKKNIPGAAALVREIQGEKSVSKIEIPFYFISGSPKQLENVIKEKFELDRISHEGLILKDFGAAIRSFQFSKLIDKIGFKFATLLYGRTVFPHKANEILFGDDSEYDATIYSLYADFISGKLEGFEVLTILKKWGVAEDEINLISWIMDKLKNSGWKNREAVKRIFIHLEMGSAPHDHLTLSRLVTPTNNYFQTAIILYNMELISRAGLFRIISELMRKYKFSLIEFKHSLGDLLNRKLMEKKEARKLIKMVSKIDSPALPQNILALMRSEFKNMLDTFTKVQSQLNPLQKKPIEKSLVEMYFEHIPVRRV